ncbi:MAG: bifunctional DNA-formamidopyrimidine glycosylase/DNA-(apurinic or apyrimidinic site) lyase [Lautropia sp.]
MPELPEVEVVRLGLADAFVGRRVRRAVLRRADLRWPMPTDLDARVAGRVLEHAGRRAKYLLLGFETGTLIVHLGMSGTLRHRAPGDAPGPHDHVDLDFGDRILRLNDPRRFGAVLWSGEAPSLAQHTHPLLAGLGVEPLDEAFAANAGTEVLYRATRGRSASIKQILLAGGAVVGVGNIYACESLFRAGIRPTLAAHRLSRPRLARLAQAIRETLAEAIVAGGSTLRDFVGSGGESGYFQLRCFVYGRAGEPCRLCATPVRVVRQQQRATFFCPACQRR